MLLELCQSAACTIVALILIVVFTYPRDGQLKIVMSPLLRGRHIGLLWFPIRVGVGMGHVCVHQPLLRFVTLACKITEIYMVPYEIICKVFD